METSVSKEVLFSVTKKDFDISWFSGTGKGGQYRNKHQNCCRITHTDSGATGIGQNNRSRITNQREAFDSLVKSGTFQKWLRIQVAKKTGEYAEIDKAVERSMRPENIVVEVMEDGKFVVVEDERCEARLEYNLQPME